MYTIGKHEEIPKGLAVRLAGHYSQRATDVLAQFYWTGRIMPAAWMAARKVAAMHPYTDSRDRRDPVAALAGFRALESYLKAHDDQPAQEGWRDASGPGWFQFMVDYHGAIVPWSWGAPGEVRSS